MKRIFLLLLTGISVAASAQTAEEIVDKFSKAMGGTEAFAKVKSAKITGTTTLGEQSFPITIQMLNGRAMRTEISVMGQTIINVYKDGKGWMVNPLAGASSATDVEGTALEDFKAQASLGNALMNYKSQGSKIELKGKETIEGVETYKIMLTASDGRITYYNIDTKDYKSLKSVTNRDMMGQMMEVETYYSDFKTISGLQFPMTRTNKIQGEKFQEIQLTSIELDVPIDEKIFDKG